MPLDTDSFFYKNLFFLSERRGRDYQIFKNFY